jgi:mono/diheme cytochrome c family protein
VPLSEPPPAGAVYGAPTPELGYLHVNCGHCHNPNGSAWVDSHMVLRLGVDEHDVTTSQIYQTTVGVELEQWIDRGYTYRIVAGDPDASAIAYRMAQRGTAAQMPPIATEFVDDTGLASIRAWIQSLSN